MEGWEGFETKLEDRKTRGRRAPRPPARGQFVFQSYAVIIGFCTRNGDLVFLEQLHLGMWKGPMSVSDFFYLHLNGNIHFNNG